MDKILERKQGEMGDLNVIWNSALTVILGLVGFIGKGFDSRITDVCQKLDSLESKYYETLIKNTELLTELKTQNVDILKRLDKMNGRT